MGHFAVLHVFVWGVAASLLQLFTGSLSEADVLCDLHELEEQGYVVNYCVDNDIHGQFCKVIDVGSSAMIEKQCLDGVWVTSVTSVVRRRIRRKRFLGCWFHSCHHGQPPRFVSNCPPYDLRDEYTASYGFTTVSIRWTKPSATDDDGQVESVRQISGTLNGGSFEGSSTGKKHTIMYVAIDNGNQKAYCTFSFLVKVITCGYPDSIANGGVDYSGIYYGDTATYRCDRNYQLTGGYSRITCQSNSEWSHMYYKPSCVYNNCASHPCQNGGTCTDLLGDYRCRCQSGWTGMTCGTVVSCGYPDNIAHGVVSYRNIYYRATTTYTCNRYYKLKGRSNVRTCLSNATWSGQKPLCVYTNYCASHPCQNGATCTDLLGDYQCRCQSGWSGQTCEKDTQAPVMSGCPSDQTVFTTNHNLHINWTEPAFVDPMGKDIHVTTNYPTSEFTFPWGDFTVQHVATKPSNGLQTECSFQFHVRPNPCDDLNIPIHGARVCNGWKTDYGRFCMVTCQTTYTIDPTSYSYDTLYVCGASGKWIAPGPLPDCKIHMSDVASIVAKQPSYSVYSHNLTCGDPATKLAIQKLYIDTISADENFQGFCSKYADECVSQNVLVDC